MLTARSPLKGEIAEPRVAWSFRTTGGELAIELLPAEGTGVINLAVGTSVASRPLRRLQVPDDKSLDIDDSGMPRPAAETFHERWAKVLPDIKGMQRTAWSHTWTDQKVCRLQLFAYDQGFDKPRMVWESDPPEDTIFSPLNIVCDIDDDGVQEICVAAHYRVMVFEGTTGRKETELRYHSNRPYGWFGLFDVDGDGVREVITIGDFQSHIDVLTYDPSKPEKDRLAVKWRRDIETNIDERRRWPHVGPRPVVDVTGDGRPEIVLSLYNDTGDGEWHVVVLDAATGETLHDWPKRFTQGSADLDGDDAEELFLVETDGVLVPTFGTVSIVRPRAEADPVIKSIPMAAFGAANLPQMDANWSTSATAGMRHVLVTPADQVMLPAFLLLERQANAEAPFPTKLSAMQLGPDDQLRVLWSVGGFPGVPEPIGLVSKVPNDESTDGTAAVSENRGPGGVGALVRLALPAHSSVDLRCTRARATVVEQTPLLVNLSTPVVARLESGGSMAVVVETPAQRATAIASPSSNGEPELLWHRFGRGMSDGSRFLGLLAVDLDGDGGAEVVGASQTAAGQAVLVAWRHDGSEFWRLPFEQTLGAQPVWNVPALTFWWPGHFRDRARIDLFVNTRRGLMHSDVGQLVDGRTGEVIWRQEKAIWPGEFSWGYAGIPPGIADLDGDGLDEIVSLYPVCFWIADGWTGKLTAGRDLASKKLLPAWAAYGESMIHDFTGDGRPDVLLDSHYILALLDATGQPIWHGLGRMAFPTSSHEGNAGQTTLVKHALLDVDGDGALEIASGGYADGVRMIDAKSGDVLWSLEAPAPTCPRVVAADIDGRAGDEILYPAGDTLVAITGDRTAGRVLWTWKGPAALSMPAVADTDEDGRAEIVTQSADGAVHCLDSRRQ
ncbi:MAG: hypothetical protein AMXMBFR13_09140 [Phycisphaerae bacterium]